MSNLNTFISPEFTGKIKMTKSLKVSMIPIGETEHWIAKHKVFEKDRELFDKNLKARPILDEFIKYTVSRALPNLLFDFEAYYLVKKDRTKARAFEKELAKTVTDLILKEMDELKSASLIDSADFVKTTLKKFAGTHDIPGLSRIEAIESLEAASKLTALNGKFNTSRIAIINTLIPKRIIENFDIYLSNMEKIRNVYESGEFGFLFERYPDTLLFMEPANYRTVCSPEAIEDYNRFISGYGDSTESWIKGFNQELSEASNSSKSSNGGVRRYSLIKPLHKQHLFETKKFFTFASISSDDDVRELINSVKGSTEDACLNALAFFSSSDPKTLFVKGSYLHTLSAFLYGSANSYILPERIKEGEKARLTAEYDSVAKKTKAVTTRYNVAMNNISKKINEKIFSLADIDAYCCDISKRRSVREILLGIMQEMYAAVYGENGKWSNIEAEAVLDSKTKIWKAKNGAVAKAVNDYLTAILEIRKFIRPFALRMEELEELGLDTSSALDAGEITNTLFEAVRAQKLVHAYLTRNDADIALSTQVYFGGTQKAAASWWNYETGDIQNRQIALAKKDGMYYFIGTFDERGSYSIEPASPGEDYYEMLDVKKGQDANKQIKKVLFSNKAIREHFADSSNDYVITTKVNSPITVRREIFDKYQAGEFKLTSQKIRKGDLVGEKEMTYYREYMDLLFQMAKGYTEYSRFNMDTLLPIEEYDTENDLLDDVNTNTIDYRWVRISAACIDDGVRNGDIFVFRAQTSSMYGKRENKKGYTGLFLELVSDENLLVTRGMSLNSAMSIYYRAKVHDAITVHKKGDVLVNKFTNARERIPENSYKAICAFYNSGKSIEELTIEDRDWLAKATTRICSGEIIKDRRYTKNQYSISISYNINRSVNNRKRVDLATIVDDTASAGRIISVTRGTKDLVYYTVIDDGGSVIEARSLNVINGINYAKMLAQISEERHDSNANFDIPKRVETIKEAYCAFAVHEIISAALKHNALIVVELISDAIKDKYSLLDNQVFLKFENVLKNCLMSVKVKGARGMEPGSISNPLQLCNADDKSFRNGILYQIPSSYINICPVTGYADIIDYYNIVSAGDIRNFFVRFENIVYNKEKARFEFSFDLKNIPIKLEKCPDRTKWTVLGRGEITTYDPLTKSNHYVFDAAQMLAETVSKEGLDPCANIVEHIDELSAATLKKMFNTFRNIAKGIVSECDEVPVSYYKSPVIDEADIKNKSLDNKSISEIKCYNLDEKARYYLALAKSSSDGENKNRYVSSTAIEWLNYIQEKRTHE